MEGCVDRELREEAENLGQIGWEVSQVWSAVGR